MSLIGTSPKKLIRAAISIVAVLGAIAYVASQSNPSQILGVLRLISADQIAEVLAVLLIGALLAAIRLKVIAADIGQPIDFRDAVAALSVGQLAGNLFFQVVGQLIARSTLLARRGIPISATVIMTGYERVAALAVSLALALAGAWFLFGRISLDLQHGGIDLLKIISAVLLATVAGSAFGWISLVKRKSLSELGAWPLFFGRATRVLLMSIGVQLSTLGAYLILARGLAPMTPVDNIAAAAVIVMLAASLPISLAGWGVREVSAVLALGVIGLSPAKALVVALGVGLSALVVVAILAVLSTSGGNKPTAGAMTSLRARAGHIDYGAALSWFLPLATATAIFFQIHVPTTHGDRLNVNLADPFALLGGVLFVVWTLRDRKWPTWRLRGFNSHVLAATLVMILGFLHGWDVFGWTAWAATNKLFGWFVLLGYGATGALVMRQGDEGGHRIFINTFSAAGIAIILIAIFLMALRIMDVSLASELTGSRATGFAANPNAFAFQILMITAALVAVVPEDRIASAAALFALPIIAVLYTGSRAGIGTEAILLIAAFALCRSLRRSLALGFTAAIVFVLAVPLIVHLNTALIAFSPKLHGGGLSATLGSLSGTGYNMLGSVVAGTDKQHLESIYGALRMFQAHPFFGAGLGAFMHNWILAHGTPLVIHSTPLWLLAEFGLTGSVIILAPFARIFFQELRSELRVGSRDRTKIVLLLIVLAFGIISTVHEMLYERTFWLLLGASLALSRGRRRNSEAIAAEPHKPDLFETIVMRR